MVVAEDTGIADTEAQNKVTEFEDHSEVPAGLAHRDHL